MRERSHAWVMNWKIALKLHTVVLSNNRPVTLMDLKNLHKTTSYHSIITITQATEYSVGQCLESGVTLGRNVGAVQPLPLQQYQLLTPDTNYRQNVV